MSQNSNLMFCKHTLCGASWSCIGIFISALLFSAHTRAQTYEDPLFAAAMQHVDKQEWQKAEALLEFQLSQNNDLHRARVELALVYAKQSKFELARKNLDQVLAVKELPDNVRTNIYRIRQRLAQDNASTTLEVTAAPADKAVDIPAETGHKLKSYAEVAIGHDDNVRFSSDDYFVQDNPFQDGVFIQNPDGMVFFVAPDGFIYDEMGNQVASNDGFIDLGLHAPDNTFYEASLNFDHSYTFGGEHKLKWYNQVDILASENAEFSSHNKLQVKLNTGFNWLLSDQVKADVGVLHRVLKRNGVVQVRGTKITPALTYYNHWGSWELGFSWQQREYEDATFTFGDFNSYFYGFETKSRSLSTKWSNLFLDNDLLLLGKLELQDSNASDGLDNKAVKATAIMLYSFNDDWKWQFSASRLLREYKSEVVVSGGDNFIGDVITENRKDRSITFKSRLSYDINSHWQAFLSAERGMRRSAIYNGIESDKTQVKLGLRLNF